MTSFLGQVKIWSPYYSEETPNGYYFTVCADLYTYGHEVAPKREFGFGPDAVQPRTTKELHPVFTTILEPRKRIITSMGRVLNLPFAFAEVVQILSGQNDAQSLKYYNSKILEFQGDAPDAVRFNAAYGERVRRFDVNVQVRGEAESNPRRSGTVDQLQHVIETLRRDPDSRQATIVISHPFYDNYTVSTKDRACNLVSHAMIRNGKLDWLQVMRSNDIVFGLPYNIFQWTHVQEWVATQLGVPMGQYTLVQDSLHCYENQYDDLRNLVHFDMYDYFEEVEYFPMLEDIKNVAHWEKRIREFGPQDLGRSPRLEYWREVVEVFNAYAAFKRRDNESILNHMPLTFELRWPLWRWFVSTRWGKKEEFGGLVEMVRDDFKTTGFPEDKVDAWLGL